MMVLQSQEHEPRTPESPSSGVTPRPGIHPSFHPLFCVSSLSPGLAFVFTPSCFCLPIPSTTCSFFPILFSRSLQCCLLDQPTSCSKYLSACCPGRMAVCSGPNPAFIAVSQLLQSEQKQAPCAQGNDSKLHGATHFHACILHISEAVMLVGSACGLLLKGEL